MSINFHQYDPHPDLIPYIDKYWVLSNDFPKLKQKTILPDGCIDIIFNFGDECITDNGNFKMTSEKVFLVGTMTRFKETTIQYETKMLGVRFKPGAFSLFYSLDSLHELTNRTVEMPQSLSPDLNKTAKYSLEYLNQYFFNKLKKNNLVFLKIIADIKFYNGQIKVEGLSRKHGMSTRKLERNFKLNIGTSPKEFINLVRYQSALSLIQKKEPKKSLLDIAFDCGYYDHSHLTNEIKRYTGLVPSQL